MEKNMAGEIVADALLQHPKRILFANFPADGHFNPLTGLAVHLQNIGHDVRWYASATYSERLNKLNIPHYPFIKAKEVIDNNFDEAFPERTKIKNPIKKLVFDMIHAFILRAPEYYEDLLEIRKSFPFDMVICDCTFTAIPFIKEKMHVPVVTIGVLPLMQTSKHLAPAGLGLTPSTTFTGRVKQAVLRFIADKILFRKANKVMRCLFKKYDIDSAGFNVFDMLVHKSDILLQSGTPGFEYERSDIAGNIRFIGALLPYAAKNKQEKWYNEKLLEYTKIILVTQGTVEKDTSKLLMPTLEAFKNSNHLVIVTTGGAGAQQLKEKYPGDNFVIEDFIPFEDIMPYADVFVTNGGYGGVMLSIQNQLPMVVAGVNEGKIEINARVGYFKLGINLRTETPIPSQIRNNVERIFSEPDYSNNVKKLSNEFKKYNPNELCTSYIEEIFNHKAIVKKQYSFDNSLF